MTRSEKIKTLLDLQNQLLEHDAIFKEKFPEWLQKRHRRRKNYKEFKVMFNQNCLLAENLFSFLNHRFYSYGKKMCPSDQIKNGARFPIVFLIDDSDVVYSVLKTVITHKVRFNIQSAPTFHILSSKFF
jgi:ferredoxin-thioredoxin reductase catalytic subunit